LGQARRRHARGVGGGTERGGGRKRNVVREEGVSLKGECWGEIAQGEVNAWGGIGGRTSPSPLRVAILLPKKNQESKKDFRLGDAGMSSSSAVTKK